MDKTIQGKPVEAHYLGVFDEHQVLLGDALKLTPPARIDLQIVGNQRGFQLTMPREIVIPISDPHMIGVAFFDVNKEFLCAFSFAGNPEGRTGHEEYTIRSRYIIMAARPTPTA
jgi:hypothetical protein